MQGDGFIVLPPAGTTPSALPSTPAFAPGDVVWIKAGGEGPFVVARAHLKKYKNGDLEACLFTTDDRVITRLPVVQLVDAEREGELADFVCDEQTTFGTGWILAALVTKDRSQCVIAPPRLPTPAPEPLPLTWWELLQVERPVLCLGFYATRWVAAAAIVVALLQSCAAR